MVSAVLFLQHSVEKDKRDAIGTSFGIKRPPDDANGIGPAMTKHHVLSDLVASSRR